MADTLVLPLEHVVREGAERRRPCVEHAEPLLRSLDQRSEEHTSELQSHSDLVCRLLLEKKKREPLKPRTPADDHDTTFPLTSVMVTMVLLNVDWMWQMPLWTFFLTFFLATLVIDNPYLG